MNRADARVTTGFLSCVCNEQAALRAHARGADANVRATACTTQGRARPRRPLKGPEFFLPPQAGREENFSATEIATEALTQAVAFLVAQSELALRPGMKEKTQQSRGKTVLLERVQALHPC